LQQNVVVLDGRSFQISRLTDETPDRGRPSMPKKIEFYDKNNRYHYGTLRDDGKIEVYDDANRYWYGQMNSDGQTALYDHKDRYYYGKITSGGNIELYDEANNYYLR